MDTSTMSTIKRNIDYQEKNSTDTTLASSFASVAEEECSFQVEIESSMMHCEEGVDNDPAESDETYVSDNEQGVVARFHAPLPDTSGSNDFSPSSHGCTDRGLKVQWESEPAIPSAPSAELDSYLFLETGSATLPSAPVEDSEPEIISGASEDSFAAENDDNASFEQNEEETPEPLVIDCDGTGGMDAPHGFHGEPGAFPGANGEDGGNAGNAYPGSAASDLSIELFSNGPEEATTVAMLPSGEVIYQETVPITKCRDIIWSARGGKGGNGGNGGNGGAGAVGIRGVDATRYSYGGNGGRGGSGGNAGYGSNGSEGGPGGNVLVKVCDNDSYLLMLVADCNDLDKIRGLIRGGDGGLCGNHGVGGPGGPGGPGGNSYSWTEYHTTYDSSGNPRQTLVCRTNPGGWPGPRGKNGSTPTLALLHGNDGSDGKFVIQLDSSGSISHYSHRYDLFFRNTKLVSDDELGSPHHIQFGATVFCTSIELWNDGGMPSPTKQRAMLSIRPNTDTYVQSRPEFVSYTPKYYPIKVGESAETEGDLCFYVKVPDIRSMGDDMEPFEHDARLFFDCVQLGPETLENSGPQTKFQRSYSRFHTGNGVPLHFSFPVKNTDGVKGLSTLGRGETTLLSFVIENAGQTILGGSGESHRALGVQFYRSPHAKYDGARNHFKFMDELKREVDIEKDTTDELLRGHYVFIDEVKPQQLRSVKAFVSFSREMKAYSRVGIQAEIFLQNMPFVDASREKVPGTSLSIVQRRLIEIVSEPAYIPNKNAQVVLVTSTATQEGQYEAWLRQCQNMGLVTECFPISRYGSLAPDFKLPNGLTLKEAFDGKLIVLLNDRFWPSKNAPIDPSFLLSRGCMRQSSGFSSEATWLIVGSVGQSAEALLRSHNSLDDSPHSQTFQSVSDYKKHLREQLKRTEPEDDSIYAYSISVQGTIKQLEHASRKLCRWLKKNDPLRQHTAYISATIPASEPHYIPSGIITVRHEYSRAQNSAVVVRAQSRSMASPEVVCCSAMKLACAEAMSAERRVQAFCNAIRSQKSADVLMAYKDAATSDFLWDVANAVTSQGKDLRLPSLKVWLNNPYVQAECSKQEAQFLRFELTDLATRFTCIANSKDLRPWWAPWSFKFRIRRVLVERVREVIGSWGIDETTLEQPKKALKQQVRQYIKRERGKLCVRTHCRWRKGLLYLHSSKNSGKYGDILSSTRLMDLKDGKKSLRISKPSHQALSSAEMHRREQEELHRLQSCNAVQQQVDQCRSEYLVSSSTFEVTI